MASRPRWESVAMIVSAVALAAGCASLPPADTTVPPVTIHVTADREWMDTGIAPEPGHFQTRISAPALSIRRR